MGTQQDDVGESTIPLAADRVSADRRFYTRAGAVLLLAVLGYLVWRIVGPLWQPIAWALLLGSLLAPFNVRLAARLRGRLRLASSVTLTATVLLFILPVATVAGAVAALAAQLLRRLELRTAVDRGLAFDLTHLPWLERGIGWLDANTSIPLDQVQAWIVEGSKRLLESLVTSGGTFVMGALGTAASFVHMLVPPASRAPRKSAPASPAPLRSLPERSSPLSALCDMRFDRNLRSTRLLRFLPIVLRVKSAQYSRFSCSSLHAMHSSVTGRTSRRLRSMGSWQLSHMP